MKRVVEKAYALPIICIICLVIYKYLQDACVERATKEVINCVVISRLFANAAFRMKAIRNDIGTKLNQALTTLARTPTLFVQNTPFIQIFHAFVDCQVPGQSLQSLQTPRISASFTLTFTSMRDDKYIMVSEYGSTRMNEFRLG